MRPLVMFVKCIVNPVENDYDGGALEFTRLPQQLPDVGKELLDIRLILAATTDPFLDQFPVTREEKQSRSFRLTLEEIGFDELPSDVPTPNTDDQGAGATTPQVNVIDRATLSKTGV